MVAFQWLRPEWARGPGVYRVRRSDRDYLLYFGESKVVLPRLRQHARAADRVRGKSLAQRKPEQAADLLEVIEDRSGLRSTIVTSQLPVSHWHEVLGEPTLADAILDRLVHSAYRIDLDGESLRAPKSPPAAKSGRGSENRPATTPAEAQPDATTTQRSRQTAAEVHPPASTQ